MIAAVGKFRGQGLGADPVELGHAGLLVSVARQCASEGWPGIGRTPYIAPRAALSRPVDNGCVVHRPGWAARGLVGRDRDPGRVFRIVAASGLATGLATLAVGAAGLSIAASTAAPPFRAAGAAPLATSTGYSAPVPGPVRVVRPFDPPLTPYGSGHRGVDLSTSRTGPILTAGDGVVRFAGSVAGRGVVVVQHRDGIATEYEPVRAAVRAGQPVRRGQPIGRLAGRHPGCASWCLHWGARRGEAYLDPLALLRPLGPVRLLPWRPDG